ncbi:hypothetical protein IFM89_012814 [Coptis chinensis]|uniref:Nudix hydrolase domain-containing protein n=1 Tax=Coptis chinensis TaxID=261450 RepID=A0A835LE68_9MAGN|nr:hypothetical protein IFM89_012814 [Coptis chinensis]
MSDLVARTGRLHQRYEDGYRLVAGCIPFKYRDSGENCGGKTKQNLQVLMINSTSGPGLLFPKGIIPCGIDVSGWGYSYARLFWMVYMCMRHTLEGGWENDETVEQAATREAIEEAGVRGEIMDCLGRYRFKSKTHQDEFSPEGLCEAAMFPLFVKEELNSWPEQNTRQRRWLTIPEAAENCRHAWMREVLEEGFCKWHEEKLSAGKGNSAFSVSSSPPDQ